MAKWKILNLNRRVVDGFVISAHWEASLSNDKYSARIDTACYFDGEVVTPYESLSEEQVLGWVWERINKEDVESALASEIEVQKNPITAVGTPWQSI